MPTISWFYGIAVRMYFLDHPPPHFQAVYGEQRSQYRDSDRRSDRRAFAANGGAAGQAVDARTPRRIAGELESRAC
jgi:hypothetical protein